MPQVKLHQHPLATHSCCQGIILRRGETVGHNDVVSGEDGTWITARFAFPDVTLVRDLVHRNGRTKRVWVRPIE